MLQELTNKIKKILPEIDELVFGCYYKVKNRKGIFRIRSSQEVDVIRAMDIKIIGRDITLEDVLRCLGGNRAYFVDSDSGCFYRSNLSKGTYEYLGFNWQLGKPLHEQSEETIKELNKLI